MANTLQKKLKFNKGEINQGLQERTDLSLFDSSASVIENYEPTMYGGLKTRMGSTRLTEIEAFSYDDKLEFTAETYIGGNESALENGSTFIANGLYGASKYFDIDLGSVKSNFLFKLNRVKYIYESFKGTIQASRVSATGNFPYEITMQGLGSDLVIEEEGVAIQTPALNLTPLTNTLAFTTDSKGAVTGATGSYTYKFTWQGTKPQYMAWDGKRVNTVTDTHTEVYSMVDIQTSSDGNTWTTVDTITVDETLKDFQTQITSARYVRVKPQTTTLKSQIMVGEVLCLKSGSQTTVGEVRLINFTYNNLEQYLFLLCKGRIDIYRITHITPTYFVPNFIESVNAPVLTDEIIKDIKWTYKDDTIIFTHETMAPRKLLRLADNNWDWQQITLENIPKELFGSATVTAKTVTLTPDKAEGIVTMTAGSSVFDATYEGQIIDGNGGRVRVTKYVSATKVSGYTIIPFYNTDSFSSWNYESGYEAVWSASKGYPRCCCIANERLFFGGTPTKPNTIWASRIADYFNFKNTGNYDNDSISFTMDTNAVIYDMIFNRGLHIFTSDFEASSPENSFKPTSFKVIPTTNNGIMKSTRPVVADNQIIYIDSKGAIRNYIYNDSINSYESENLSKLIKIENPVRDITVKKGVGDIPTHIYLADGTNRMKVMYISLSDDITAPVEYYISENTKILQVCCIDDIFFYVSKRQGTLKPHYFLEYERNYSVMFDDYHNVDFFVEGGKYKIVDDTMVNEKFIWTESSTKRQGQFDENGVAYISYPATTIGIPVNNKIVGNKIAINHKTNSIKKRISKATVVCKGQEITFCNQTKKIKEDDYQTLDFYACTLYGKDITYNIEGTDNLDILSITLNINYEG